METIKSENEALFNQLISGLFITKNDLTSWEIIRSDSLENAIIEAKAKGPGNVVEAKLFKPNLDLMREMFEVSRFFQTLASMEDEGRLDQNLLRCNDVDFALSRLKEIYTREFTMLDSILKMVKGIQTSINKRIGTVELFQEERGTKNN